MSTRVNQLPVQVGRRRGRPKSGCAEEFSLRRSEVGGGAGAPQPSAPIAAKRLRASLSAAALAVVGVVLVMWAAVRRPISTGDRGMTTAEYAVGTVAACAFAAILYQVVTGGSVVAALGNLIQSALSALS